MAVWLWNPVECQRKLLVDQVRVDCGVGFPKGVYRSPLVSRANGYGSIGSNRGAVVFRVKLTAKSASDANAILTFLQDRINEGYASFQFYNPREREIDTAGASTTGMYWVKHLEPVTEDIRLGMLTDYVELTFEEDLSAY